MNDRPLVTQRRLLGNTGLLAAAEVFVQLLSLAFVILLARTYGRELLGVYSYAMAIGGMLSILVSLGTNGTVLRQLSREPEQTATVTGALLGFQCCAALVLLLAAYLSQRWLAASPLVVSVVTLIVAYHVLMRVTSLFVLGFLARQEAGPAAVLPVARQGIVLLFAGAAMISGTSATLTLASMPLAALLVLIGMGLFAVRRFGPVQLRFRSAEIGRYLREGRPYFYVIALATLYSRLGIVYLTVLSGEAEVGVFSAGERLVVAAGAIQVMFSAALLPVVTQLWKDDPRRFAELTQRAGRAIILLTLPMATLLALFSDEIVHLLYADEFKDASGVLAAIAWILVVRGIAQLLSTTATAADHQHMLWKSRMLGLVVLTVTSLGLIPAFGAQGLVAATLVSEISAVAFNYFLLQKAGVPLMSYSGGLRVAMACVLAACLAYLVSEHALALRLPVVVGGGAAALWLFGAVRNHDLKYLRAILKARESHADSGPDA